MSSKRILTIIGIVALLAIIILAVGSKQGWFGNEGFLKVAVEKGEKRDIVEVITANGKIQPETEVNISPDVSGEIVELVVKEGDEVEKNQFLLKIKPDNYIMIRNRAEASLNNAKARLKQAEAQLELSRLNHKRNSALYEENAISESEFETSLTNFNTARAEKEAAEYSVESAMASLQEAEENLQKTSIYAPMSGTISSLEVELGERVVGTELMSGTEILRIADLSKMEVEVEVNENDIVKVAYGDTALIEVDAYPDTRFKGVVTEIPVSANTSGLTTDQVTNFMVKIRLLPASYTDKVTEANPNPLRPGMSATADIQTDTKVGVFSIPIQAVTTRVYDPEKMKQDSLQASGEQPGGDTSEKETAGERAEAEKKGASMARAKAEKEVVVFVAEEGKAIMKLVETGIQDNSYIEIKEGLSPEDRVIIAPYSAVSKQLRNDLPVEVVSEEALFKQNED